MKDIKIEITKSLSGKSVGDIIRTCVGVSSRQLTALKKSGGIVLDGKSVTVRETVTEGQVLCLHIDDEKPSENIVPSNIPITVLYEDEDILAVAKPKDMPVHPSANNYDNTLGNACMYYYRGTNFVFRPITRLDRDTTGVVIVAKNKLAATKLSEQMQAGKIHKNYIALLSSTPEPLCGRVDAPIGRCEDSVIKRCVRADGKDALTEYNVIRKRADGTCIVSVRPITGRTHQIRVHMQHIGCPLLYDYLYGKEIQGKTLFLHCSSVSFIHPSTQVPMAVECPIFDDSELLQ